MKIIPNFIELPVFNDEYVAGTNKSLPFKYINENGDWRSCVPLPENQFKNDLETSACGTFATLTGGVEILQTYQYGIQNPNCSDRYIATLSGTTPKGNNIHRISQAIRNYGVIPEERLPFHSTIDTWNEYYDRGEVEALKAEGRKWLNDWDFQHEWIITRDTPFEVKRAKIALYLKASPIVATVYGWYEYEKGIYYKPKGCNDNHVIVILAIENNKYIVLDSYEPYIKRLDINYDFDFAKRFMLTRKERTFISFARNLIN